MKKALTMLYTHHKAINRGLIGHKNRRIDTQTDRQIEIYKFIYLDIFLEPYIDTNKHYFFARAKYFFKKFQNIVLRYSL